jgi:tRNA-specific 2-thiouridylase
LGTLKKSKVKEIAAQAKLDYIKKESTDICFLKNSSLSQFLKNKLEKKPGEIIDKEGLVIGQHQGLAFYTIGQRRALVINHQALKKSRVIVFDTNHPPALAVTAKKNKTNQLVVDRAENCLFNEFQLSKLHFINKHNEQLWRKKTKLNCQIKIRNTGKLIPSQIKKNQNKVFLTSQKNFFAPATGQAAVFYQQKADDLLVIGGATIDNEAVSS